MNFEQFLTEIISAPVKTHTDSGKEISHFTMSCRFHRGDRPGWTYRGDHEVIKCHARKFLVKNQLEALLLKYNTIKDNIKSCKIYNNKNNQLNQIIFDQCSDGRININKIEEELQLLRKQKNEKS